MNPNNHYPRGILAVRAEGNVPEPIVKALDGFTDEVRTFRNATDARIQELEQRLADGLTSVPGAAASGSSPGTALAAQLVADDTFQAVAGKRSTKGSINVTASMLLPSVQANTIRYDTGQFDVTERQPGIVSGVQRRRWLRSRFINIPTTGGAVEYHRELTFTNAAAPQGGGSPFEHEGVAKAESAITYEPVEKKVPTIAHFIKASKQILADLPLLGVTLDQKLRYGLELAVESQIISGSGTGANMSGLTASGNFTAFTPTSGDTAIDSLNRSLAAIETAEGMPDLIVMHPKDFRAMQRAKTSGSGEFLFGAPNGANSANVWNTEIHVTPALAEGKFIALDTQQMGVMCTREDANVTVGWVNDDYTRNLCTILAETRLMIAVQRPTMVRYGSLVL